MKPPLLLLTLKKSTYIVLETCGDRHCLGVFGGFAASPHHARRPEELPDVILRFYPENMEVHVPFSSITGFSLYT